MKRPISKMTSHWSKAVTRRPTEFQMPDHIPRSNGGGRRIEPIFDASGTLRRHALSRSDTAARKTETGDKGDE